MMMVIDTLGKNCMRYIRKIEHNEQGFVSVQEFEKLMFSP